MPKVTDDFLTQYAAQAVIDLEHQVKLFARASILDYTPQFYLDAQRQASTANDLAQLLRHAVKLVLPKNGEIYRANGHDGPPAEPTAEELLSLAWMPAAVTSFEFPFEAPHAGHDAVAGLISAPRRLVLVVDGRQQFGQSEDAYTLQFFSLIYSEQVKRWGYHRNSLLLRCPLQPTGPVWTPVCHELDIGEGHEQPVNFIEWLPDLTAVLQACHALQLGAELTARTETSSSRRWRYEKNGAGSFRYHVLARANPSISPLRELAYEVLGAPPVRLGTPVRLPKTSRLLSGN